VQDFSSCGGQGTAILGALRSCALAVIPPVNTHSAADRDLPARLMERVGRRMVLEPEGDAERLVDPAMVG
jgi:hypothetical protein